MYISCTSCAFFYRIDHGKIRSRKAAANGGKPPAGGSSPASKPRAPSEKRFQSQNSHGFFDVPMDFPMDFSPNMGQNPMGFPGFCQGKSLEVAVFPALKLSLWSPEMSCAAAHFFAQNHSEGEVGFPNIEGEYLNLVGGLEHCLFSIIYGMASFPLTFIFFKMVKI